MKVDYISKTQCNVIKGFFILVVFFSHFQGYIHDAGGRTLDLHLGQLMVAMFLFYSGYGVAESIAKKGETYVRDFPKKRILMTLLNFDVAVLTFVILDLIIGRPIGLRQMLLSFVCWESVGNSNWYIFAIIYCYAVTWLFLGILNLKKWGRTCVFAALAASVVVLSYIRPSWWYDTMLCFAAGVLFSQYRQSFERRATRHFWLMLASVVLAFLTFRHCGLVMRGLTHNAQAVMFSMMIILVTMKMTVRSRLLEWCGERLFPIYIYQRIPMLIFLAFDPAGFATARAWLYFPVCLGVTLLIAKWYHLWQIKL